jgi:hypothetical protein
MFRSYVNEQSAKNRSNCSHPCSVFENLPLIPAIAAGVKVRSMKQLRQPRVRTRSWQFPFNAESTVEANARRWKEERCDLIRHIRKLSKIRNKVGRNPWSNPEQISQKMTRDDRERLRVCIHTVAFYFRQLDAAVAANNAAAASFAAVALIEHTTSIAVWFDHSAFECRTRPLVEFHERTTQKSAAVRQARSTSGKISAEVRATTAEQMAVRAREMNLQLIRDRGLSRDDRIALIAQELKRSRRTVEAYLSPKPK